jgi:hypothetical protein
MPLTTVPDKSSGDLFTEAMWDTYLKDNINELIGRAGGGNLLVNGGMEICQRGAGPFNGGGTAVVGLDCWKGNRTNVAGTSAVAMSQDVTTIDAASSYSMKCVITYTAITSEVYQKLEEVVSLRGKTLTFAIRINQPSASYITPFFRVDGAKTYGTPNASTGSWVTLSQSQTMGSTVASIEVGVEFGTSAQTCYLDNAMLVVGATASAYVARHPAEELARCQRYYEVHGASSGHPYVSSYGAAGAVSAGISWPYAVAKPASPTVTKNGTWAVTNCAQPAITAGGTAGYTLTTTVTALGGYTFNPNSADDTITAEYNP